MEANSWREYISPLLPRKSHAIALLLFPLLILICTQLILAVGTVPTTYEYEITVTGENVTSVGSIETEVGYAASESPNSVSGL